MTLRPTPEHTPHCAQPQHPPMRVAGYGIYVTGEPAEWWQCTVCGSERIHRARQEANLVEDLFGDEP